MKFYVGENLGGTRYRVEARSDPPANMLMAIYDGYYNYKTNDFTLYRKFVGYMTQPREVPEKLRVSAFETCKLRDKPEAPEAKVPQGCGTEGEAPSGAAGEAAKRIRRDTMCEGQIQLKIEN